jgi:uncharacterized membrane protein
MFAKTLILAGAIINFIGGIRFLVAARKAGTAWFIGCIFIFVWPCFLFAHFSKAWRPFSAWLFGIIVALIGAAIRDHQFGL